MRIRYGAACLLSAITLCIALPIPAAAQSGQNAYGYCIAKLEAPVGKIHYLVSSAFRHRPRTYHIGVQNSFTSYVEANSHERWGGWTLCHTDYDSWQEAEDNRNDTISDYRRDAPRTSVSTVNWSYRGD